MHTLTDSMWLMFNSSKRETVRFKARWLLSSNAALLFQESTGENCCAIERERDFFLKIETEELYLSRGNKLNKILKDRTIENNTIDIFL